MTTDKLISKYYEVASLNEIEKYREQLFSLDIPIEEKQKFESDLNSKLDKLEDIFFKLVSERNKIAKNNGFDNYFDFVVDWYGLPKKKFEEFLEKSPELSKKIIENLPIKKLPENYWSKYSEPTMANLLQDDTSYKLPEYVYKKLQIDDKTKSNIGLKHDDYRYSFAEFDIEEKSVTVTCDTQSESSISAITFAHELGHALTYLNLFKNGIDPDSKTEYWHEYKAIQTEIKFEEKLDEKVRNANRDRFLYHFVLAYFEYLIYSNPNLDFSIEYSNARKIFMPTQEINNRFFLLNNFLIDFPIYSSLYASIYIKYIK